MKKIISALIAATVTLLCLSMPVGAAPSETYAGKTFSIMGDSISTFEGYIPKGDGVNLNHMTTYPNDALRLTVEDTWWMQVINQLGGKLGVNESWAGTRVANFDSRNQNTVGKDVCMASITRIKNLGSNGTPDVILFYGGTNDVGKHSELGSFDPSNAPTTVDLEAVIWNDFSEAYVAAIMRMQHFYPDAEIYALLPNTTEYHKADSFNPYIEIMEAVCAHYGVETVDLRESGINIIHLPDGTHPDKIGMDLITEQVIKTMTHTHNYTATDELYHSCECGKKVDHALTTTKGFLGSTTTTCSVCAYSCTDNMPMIFTVAGIAGAIVVIAVVLIIIGTKKKKNLP